MTINIPVCKELQGLQKCFSQMQRNDNLLMGSEVGAKVDPSHYTLLMGSEVGAKVDPSHYTLLMGVRGRS